MPIQTLTEPAFEPVSRAEAKAWCRIEADDTAHDAIIDMLVQALREEAENRTQRAFIARQMRLTLDDWPASTRHGPTIVLPFPPLVSVDSVKYVDTDGNLQTLAASQYVVYDEYEPAFIVPAWQVTWPTIRMVPDALQITYTAGYASGSPPDEQASQEVMPAKLRLWLQARLATLFENREQLVQGNQVEIPRAFADAQLDSLIVGSRLF